MTVGELAPDRESRLRAQISRWRDDLFDLSKRNCLLWFRATATTPSSCDSRICALFMAVTFHTIEGEEICLLNVEPSDHPVLIEKDGAQILLLRQGNATRSLDPKETLTYANIHWPDR